MISFGGGNPSAETFPVPEIADIIADVMKNAPVSVLQYGLSEGYTPLRDTMKDYLTRTQGFDFENNERFILSRRSAVRRPDHQGSGQRGRYHSRPTDPAPLSAA